MRFEIFRNGESYRFRLLDDTQKNLLTSSNYGNVDECVAGIRSFAESALLPANYVNTEKNSFAVLINGTELGKSVSFTSRPQATRTAEAIRNFLTENTDYQVIFTETRTRLIQRPVLVAETDTYDFTMISFSGTSGFDAFKKPNDEHFYFFFNDAAGKEFLFSQRYNTESSRDNGIRSVIQNAKNEKRYQIFEETGKFYFILKAVNGREIARSRMFESRTDVEQAMLYLQTTVVNFEKQYEKPEKIKHEKTSPTDLYNFTIKSKSGTQGFEAIEADKKQYFHFNDAKGKAILFSQSYENNAGRNNGIKSVIKNAHLENRYEIIEENDKFYFILKAGNKQEIARSTLFNSLKEMNTAMTFLKSQSITYAAQYKVKLETETRTDIQTQTFNIHIDRPSEEDLSDRNIDEYDFTQVSKSGKKGFEVFQSEKNNKFYFHFNDENGKAILFSESYANAKVRDNGIRSVIKNAPVEKRWRNKEENGKFFYSLLAGNGQEIAKGPNFDSQEKMLLGLNFVQKSSVDFADEYGVDLKSFGIVVGTAALAGLGGLKETEMPAINTPETETPLSEIPKPLLEEVKVEIPETVAETPEKKVEIPEIKTVIPEPAAPKMPPMALDVVNGQISGRAGAVSIKSLAGRDADGKVVSYTILTVPSVEKGVLLLNGVPVLPFQTIMPSEAGRLQFDPSGKSAGNTVFTYKVTDDNDLESNVATFTIPVMNVPPIAKDISFGTLKSDAGATKIDPLIATDSDGQIAKYIITALPAVVHGTLLLKNVPVKEQQELTPAEMQELQFKPEEDFSGTVKFQYKAYDDNQLFSNVANYTIEVEKPVAVFIPPLIPIVPTIELSKEKPKVESVGDEIKPIMVESVKPVVKPIVEPLKPIVEPTKPIIEPIAAKNIVPLAETVAEESGKVGGGIFPWLAGAAVLGALAFGTWWYLNNQKSVPQTTIVTPEVVQPKVETTVPTTEKNIPVPVTIENFKPINLYFNNDHPNPRTEDSKTTLTYEQTYQAYYVFKNQFASEFSKGLAGAEAQNAQTQVSDFFDGKVKKGYDDLIALSEKLLAKLKEGNKVEITVTGFASPLAPNDYNQKLTSRRVSSIENYLRAYKGGEYRTYMDKGLLLITQKTSGEEEANQSISDDLTDTRNSWYSPAASSERRVEITNVTVSKP